MLHLQAQHGIHGLADVAGDAVNWRRALVAGERRFGLRFGVAALLVKQVQRPDLAGAAFERHPQRQRRHRAPIHIALAVDLPRGVEGRQRGACHQRIQHAVIGVVAKDVHTPVTEDRGRNIQACAGNRAKGERRRAAAVLQKLIEAAVVVQAVLAAGDPPQHAHPAARIDDAAAHLAPDGGNVLQLRQADLTGKVCCIQCTHRAADHCVRQNVVLQERSQRSDLHGAQCAAPA